MKNLCKKVLCSTVIFLFAFFGIMSDYALAAFPDTIGPISRSSNAAYPRKNGIDFFGQQYKYDTASGKAVFCVEYSKGFVANAVCNSLQGSDQDWSIPTKAGIATIIREANFGNPQPSSVTSAQLDTNLNISLALNQFLIEVGEGEYYNKIPYDVDVNQFIPGNYRTIIDHAKDERNRVKKALQGNDNERLDVDVSLHKRYTNEKSVITYNPELTTNETDKVFVITAPLITDSTLTARVYRGGTLPNDVTIKVYSGTSLDNMPLRFTFTNTSATSQDISVDASSRTNYIRIEIVDNRSDKSAAFRVYPSITAYKSMSYYVAQKYDCGDDEQSLTPNITEKITRSENDSASMSFKTVGIPDYPSLKIVKKDSTGNRVLQGAKFNIIKNPDSDDKTIVQKYTNSDGEINYDALEDAEYCVIETRAPSGFLLDNTRHCFSVSMISSGTSNTISVDKKGDSKIEITNDTDGNPELITITLDDNPNLIKLGKKVKENGTYVYKAGARLKLTTENNRDAEPYTHKGDRLEWSTSDVLVKEISELPAGIYYLFEMEAPEGYSLNPDPVKVTVSTTDTGEKSFFVKNQLTSVKIRKVDASTPGIALTGARLQIVDSNNNVVAGPWTSDNTDHVVTGLAAGDYWLEELNPPKGYSKVSKIKFTINEYGDVLLKNDELETQTVVLSNQKNEVYVTKTDITGAETIEGAKLQILDSNNKPVKLKKVGDYLEPDDSGDEYWISSDKPEKIKGLEAGKYKLKEILAPDGYVLSTEVISFEIGIDGKVKVNNNVKDSKTLIMTNEYTKVYISKQDITNKGVELPGATLVLENSDGVEIERWESGNEPHLIEGLKAGTYKLTEIIAPEGYTKTEESITFTIDENGVVSGDTVMYNTPKPPVPKTDASTSILIIFVGLSLLGLGVGLYAYGFKKKTEI